MVRSGANKKPHELRLAAADIWRGLERLPLKQRKREAALQFAAKHPGAVSRPGDFCRHWGERLTKEFTLHDAKRTGRPRSVTDADADRAAALLRALDDTPGYPQNGYSSAQDACFRSEELDKIRQQANNGKGCSYKTLLRAAKRKDPLLGMNPIRFKPPLSVANRQKRVAHAKRSLRQWRESRQHYK